jgi:hypothetical protein
MPFPTLIPSSSVCLPPPYPQESRRRSSTNPSPLLFRYLRYHLWSPGTRSRQHSHLHARPLQKQRAARLRPRQGVTNGLSCVTSPPRPTTSGRPSAATAPATEEHLPQAQCTSNISFTHKLSCIPGHTYRSYILTQEKQSTFILQSK